MSLFVDEIADDADVDVDVDAGAARLRGSDIG